MTVNVKDTRVRIMVVVLVLLPEWEEESIKTACYLASNFGGVSDMHHGRGDLQPREVLAFH